MRYLHTPPTPAPPMSFDSENMMIVPATMRITFAIDSDNQYLRWVRSPDGKSIVAYIEFGFSSDFTESYSGVTPNSTPSNAS